MTPCPDCTAATQPDWAGVHADCRRCCARICVLHPAESHLLELSVLRSEGQDALRELTALVAQEASRIVRLRGAMRGGTVWVAAGAEG